MGSEFPIFEIVIFGMIAAFFVLRLKNTLGKRTGHEQERPHTRVRHSPDEPAANGNGDDNVIRLPGSDGPYDPSEDASVAGTPLEKGLGEIARAMPDFDRRGFMEGAQGAYEMIVTSFARGDKRALKPLLASKVYQNFCDAIDNRKEAGQTQETELVGFESAEIVEAGLSGRNAEVTVKFKAEMISVTRDAEGEIVGGDAEDVTVVTDVWTFSRDTRSRNPNWELIATRSAH